MAQIAGGRPEVVAWILPGWCLILGLGLCRMLQQSRGRHKTLVYDLVLTVHPVGGDEPGETLAVALKEDQLLFRRAERKARALDLPLAVRWDRLFGDLPRQERPRGEWAERFAYPQALSDWRRWL